MYIINTPPVYWDLLFQQEAAITNSDLILTGKNLNSVSTSSIILVNTEQR